MPKPKSIIHTRHICRYLLVILHCTAIYIYIVKRSPLSRDNNNSNAILIGHQKVCFLGTLTGIAVVVMRSCPYTLIIV